MLKDFNKIKAQLKELSTVLNSFKSEAVQLKIVELLMEGVPVEKITEKAPAPAKRGSKKAATKKAANIVEPTLATMPKKRGRPKLVQTKKTVKPAVKRTRKKTGPTSVLRQLIAEDFFSTSRPIAEIVKHCNEKLGMSVKSNDFSGLLMTHIKNNQLKREKDPANGVYEYMNP